MIEFGHTYRDKISGFEGVATARAEYWHSTPEVLLVAMMGKTDDAKERWVKQERLVEVAAPGQAGFS